MNSSEGEGVVQKPDSTEASSEGVMLHNAKKLSNQARMMAELLAGNNDRSGHFAGRMCSRISGVHGPGRPPRMSLDHERATVMS